MLPPTRTPFRSRRAVRPLLVVLLAGVLVAGCAEDGASPGASGSAPAGPTGSVAAQTGSPDAAATGDTGSGAAGGDGTGGGTGAGGDTDAATAPVDIPELVAQLEPSVVAILRQDGGQGSGVVWREDGLIITNNHVVEGAETVTVLFADGGRAEAEVVATDPRTDLALLRVDRTNLPAVEFRETLPQPGETAIAIGNPLGFEGSVTAGIVSGLGRSVPGSASLSPALVDLIQTDAPISPGNSGGALVGDDGRLIGINVAYLPPSTGGVSIGFAIPGPTVVDFVTQLLENGRVRHAFMGVEPATVTPQVAEAYGLSVRAGAGIVDVVPGGPAAQAGLESGDVITAVGDTQVESAEDLLAALRGASPGEMIQVSVVRGGQGEPETVPVTLVELPALSEGTPSGPTPSP